MRNNVKLFLEVFVNFSAIIRIRLIISLIKSKFTQELSKRINIYEMGAFQYCYFGNQNPRTLKWYITFL